MSSVNVTSYNYIPVIPQGSILEPLLFVLQCIVHIIHSYLANCLSLTLLYIYADNTKCIKTSYSYSIFLVTHGQCKVMLS